MAMTGKQWLDIFLYGISWWLVPLIIIFIYKKMLSKYPIGATIYEKRGNDVIVTNDCIGRFNTPINEYKMKISKDSMPIPEYEWVLQYMYKPTNLFEKFTNLLSGKIGHITLFKYGSKQYKPIRVKMHDGSFKQVYRPIKNKNGEDVYIKVYEPIDPRKSMSKLDFEVVDWDDANHLTQELRAIAARRSPILGFLERYGSYIGLALAAMALVVGGYYYKEMIIDAGNKAASLTCKPPETSGNTNNQNAAKPDIPIIGNLMP